MMTTNECIKYDMICKLGIATPDEINLVRNMVAGPWNMILDGIVCARTGYNTLEQYLEQADEEEEEEVIQMIIL